MSTQADLFAHESRADQILERFRAFHRANPHVWRLFQDYTRNARRVLCHYSADAILHRVRWNLEVETRSGDGLKINNDFAAYYARMYLATHPDAEGFFELRKRKSTERPAAETDLPFIHAGPPDREHWLRDELYALARETA